VVTKKLNGSTKWVAIGITVLMIFGSLFAQGVMTKQKLEDHIEFQNKEDAELREDIREIKRDIKELLQK
jgi:heme exporter protein D